MYNLHQYRFTWTAKGHSLDGITTMQQTEVRDKRLASAIAAIKSGDEAKAREIFAQLSPFLDLLALIGLSLCKEVLVRRGVIRTATMRIPNSRTLDQYDRYELDYAMSLLEPLFVV